MSDLTPEKSFEGLKAKVVSEIQSHFPFDGRLNRLVVENVRAEDNLHLSDIKGQMEAKDKNGTWSVPVRADIKLVNKATGQVIDSKKNTVLARIPKLTSRYGYIVGGTEYQVDHLFRLKSGVYTRVQQNGNLETEFNLLKSPTNRGFSILFDPKSMKFNLQYPRGSGGNVIPLYPVMKAVGISDDDLEHSWGKEVLAINKPKNQAAFYNALKKFWNKTSTVEKEPSNEDLVRHTANFFSQSELRPETTSITMGKPFTKVTPEALKIGAEKVIGVSRGTHKPDERDSLAFKEVVSIDDFLPEKLRKVTNKIKGKLRNGIDHKTSVGDLLHPDLYTRPINDFFTGGTSGVSERSDQTNPIQMLSAHTKTTLMSKDFGGLKNEQSVIDEMRIISPSHFGFLDPTHTPEGGRTGTTLHLASGARKNGNELETQVFDIKSGKPKWSSVADFHTKTVVLPDQVRWEGGKPTPLFDKVKVKLPGGDMETRLYKDADYVMPSAKGVFDHSSNLIPFLPSNQGNRASMANKQMEQAISLKDREAPLVQVKTEVKDPTHTYEKLIGTFSSHRSPVDGKVVEVTNDHVKVQGPSGVHTVQVYNHFPLNDDKVMMHSTPLVKVGDHVKAGQVVADTNYTRNGVLAVGTNLRYGLMAYKGYNYDDGVVISQSAAKKLTSDHLYRKEVELDHSKDVTSASRLKAYAPVKYSKMSQADWQKLDENGIIRVGEKVHSGQVLVAALGENKESKKSSMLAKLKAIKPYKDKSLVWHEDHPGVVTRVIKTSEGYKVHVKTEEPATIGDKIAGRHGDKGILTAILPDHEMPFTKDPKTGEKKPLEVVFNPLGITSRINVSQMFEIAGGKIAEKTGKPYVVNNFSGPNNNYHKQVTEDLAKHGIHDEEEIFDPQNPNKPLGKGMVGPKYTLKLRHQIDKKLTARGGGNSVEDRPLAYDLDNQPIKGHLGGGQGYGQLDIYALLGHNARHNLREMATYKSDMQDTTFWNMIQQGHEPPPPKPPFTYEKFTALLRGAGVNITKNGTSIRMSPMTDAETLRLADNGKNEVVKDTSTTYAGRLLLRAKDLKEEKDGLFDPLATGGKDGRRWSYMKLGEPVPNPIFVGQGNIPGPVPVLLGLKGGELDDIMSGKVKYNGMYGGHAIQEALKKIDVNKELETARNSLASKRGTDLDRVNKKIRFLLALKEQNLKPHEAYMMNYLPVIPPIFRPVSETHRGSIVYSPFNQLYKNIALMNTEIKTFDHSIMTEDHKAPARTAFWDSVKALASVGNYKPVYDTDNKNRELTGILDYLATGGGEHGQPKGGFVQSKLIKRRQNLSMRSTVVPEPSLHLDEVGLPKGPAMEMYKPYVVAKMNEWMVPALEAQKQIKNGSPLAHKALQTVVNERPVILKRDPVLHKFGMMALKPKLIEGKAIQINPLITGGYNMDFDGDTAALTIPMSKAAVDEAYRMLPSKNLFSSSTGEVMNVPSQETLLGLHMLTKWGKDTKKTFKDIKELSDAVDSGHVHHNDVVRVSNMYGGKPTTYGRILIAHRMPNGFELNNKILHDHSFEITKGVMADELAPALAGKHVGEFPRVVDDLKHLGNQHVYSLGYSIGLKDTAPFPERDRILAEAHKKVEELRNKEKDPKTLERKTIDVYQDATSSLQKAIKEHSKATGNRMAMMVLSGAKGKLGQFQQIVAAPMLMQDGTNRTIPTPVTKSYSEGLDIGDYWLAQHGARKGTMQRTLSSSEPGALTKDIQNSTMGVLITSHDCGTKNGIMMGVVPDEKDSTYKDAHDRHLAQPVKLRDGTILPEGTLLTPEVISRMRNSKITKAVLRSPLKCDSGEGICAKCYGLNEDGKHHTIGTNIGILAGQAMGEPATQMAMDSFHSGGTATGRGGASVDRISRLNTLLTMPETIKHQATVSKLTGKITDIHDMEGGGQRVHVDGMAHFVPNNLINPDLKVGMQVKKGDKLSEGFINPHHLLAATKDIHSVQNYLTKELQDGLYDSEGTRRRNIEVAVRSMTNLAKVTDPGSSSHEAGDIVPRSSIEAHNRSLDKGMKPIEAHPVLYGSEQIPALLTKNWMGRLNYRELHKNIMTSAARGEKAELHESHPIAGLMYGAEFGLPPHDVKSKKPHVY